VAQVLVKELEKAQALVLVLESVLEKAQALVLVLVLESA
jgi:hypothetical protein